MIRLARTFGCGNGAVGTIAEAHGVAMSALCRGKNVRVAERADPERR